MPHFIIDCSANTLMKVNESAMLTAVFKAAYGSTLFDVNDIKVRVHPYVRSEVGGTPTDFIHVFGYILEGRTDAQKADLSKRIVQSLVDLFPDLALVAASIDEFKKVGYCNRYMLQP